MHNGQPTTTQQPLTGTVEQMARLLQNFITQQSEPYLHLHVVVTTLTDGLQLRQVGRRFQLQQN